MKVRTGDPRKWRPEGGGGTVMTIGVFDGVHLGHQAVLAEVFSIAEDAGGLDRAVVTFDVHPRSVVGPGRAPKMLLTLERRLEVLEALEVDRAGVLPFDLVRSFTPEEFIRRVVVDGFAADAVVVGKGFRYGVRRSGDAARLRAAGAEHGFRVEEIALEEGERGPISSSAVRRFIADGDVSSARDMLGRPHELPASAAGVEAPPSGPPALELEIDPSMAAPPPGLYAVTAETEDQPPCAGLYAVSASAAHLYAPDRMEALRGQNIQVKFLERLDDAPSLGDPARLEQALTQSRLLLQDPA